MMRSRGCGCRDDLYEGQIRGIEELLRCQSLSPIPQKPVEDEGGDEHQRSSREKLGVIGEMDPLREIEHQESSEKKSPGEGRVRAQSQPEECEQSSEEDKDECPRQRKVIVEK